MKWWCNEMMLLFLCMLLPACGSKDTTAAIGETAKDFTLPELSGGRITLSQFRGKNILILFWTEGCVFCQTDHISAVNEIYLQGRSRELEVFSINIAEPIGDVREFVKQKRLIFPVLLDRDASVARKKYGVYVVPTMFLIGRDGLIKEKSYGYLTEKALWEVVQPYLKSPGGHRG